MHWLGCIVILLMGIGQTVYGWSAVIERRAESPGGRWTTGIELVGTDAVGYGSIWLVSGILFLIGAVLYWKYYLR